MTSSSSSKPRYETYVDAVQPLAGTKRTASSRNRTGTSESSNSRAQSRSSAAGTRGRNESMFIVAVTENRLREVGLAAIDLRAPELQLSQFADTHTYIHTSTKLHIYEPVEIIVPNTVADSELSKFLQNKFPNASFSTVQRKYFNETKGLIDLKNLVVPELLNVVELESGSKYLCLASAAALLKYTEFIQASTFAPHSLKLSLSSCDKALEIDSASLKNLEILSNLRTGQPSDSLLGVIDHTKTAAGLRLLRSNLVQPLSDISTINGRLDVVEELLENEDSFLAITGILAKILDLDMIINQMHLVQIPKSTTVKTSQLVIKSIIAMKHTLELVQHLIQAISSCQNELLISVLNNFKSPPLAVIHQEIDQIINEDCQYSKGSYSMRMQQVFAVKVGINPLLDVARKTYTETIEDIHSLAGRYREDYNMPSLKVQFNARRGHFLTMDEKSSANLPSIFLQVSLQRKRIHCTTEAIASLSRRNDESLNEIFLMTERVLNELIQDIRNHIGAIYKLSDSIAFLDMICSFVDFVKHSSCGAVRPELTRDGPLVIKQGRHPILEKIHSDPFIPNDTFCSETSNFQIITGPNMSGKSTYIRQIALLTILAQIGCFVPTQFASLRIVNRLFTRIGTSDSMESNSSTFMREMIEMSFILTNITDQSLVIIDELGRGTSTRDGIALCFSICEHLAVSSKAFTFFVTHFMEIAELETLYPNVKNYHLMVDTQDSTLRFMYQVSDGPIRDNCYGINIAERAGLDSNLIQEARELSKILSLKANEKKRQNNSKTEAETSIYQLAQRILALRNSTLDQDGIRNYLRSLKGQYNIV